jgi:hypothetical protein
MRIAIFNRTVCEPGIYILVDTQGFPWVFTVSEPEPVPTLVAREGVVERPIDMLTR